VLKHDYTVPRTDVTGALEWQLRLLADSKDGFKDDPIATAVIESLRRDLATQLADRTKQQRRQE